MHNSLKDGDPANRLVFHRRVGPANQVMIAWLRMVGLKYLESIVWTKGRKSCAVESGVSGF